MSITTAARMQCRHILASGHRCASPVLRNEEFCYYHHTTRGAAAKAEIQARRGQQSIFDLPELEDRTSIQLAIAEILRRIASHALDTRRAGLLLYGLQIASSNLPRPAAAQKSDRRAPEQVAEITLDETHGPIAPAAEITIAERDKSLEQILLEQWHRDGIEELARREAKALIDVQATVDTRVPHDYANEESVIVGVIPRLEAGVPHSSRPHRDEWDLVRNPPPRRYALKGRDCSPAVTHSRKARLQPLRECPRLSRRDPTNINTPITA